MRNIFLLSIVLIFAGILVLLFIHSSNQQKTSDIEYQDAFRRNYKIFSPPIPQTVKFAGEEMPLENILVRESFERELLINTYWHNNTILSFKRAGRWFPVIVPILKKNNIPEDFKYLALIESGLMNLVSPKGATGFWQFIEETGKIQGLEINKEVDERYHVEKSTEAACKYLAESYSLFGNWALVAAAYNAGKKRISDAVDKQKTNSYFDLFLNEETSRYVFRIAALKTIYESPAQYGYYLRETDLYSPLLSKEIEVATSVTDLITFAKQYQISYKVLKEFNPWLRSDRLTNTTGKRYLIRVPLDTLLHYRLTEKEMEGYNRIFNDTLQVNEIN